VTASKERAFNDRGVADMRRVESAWIDQDLVDHVLLKNAGVGVIASRDGREALGSEVGEAG
jgi:hypothetical protein